MDVGGVLYPRTTFYFLAAFFILLYILPILAALGSLIQSKKDRREKRLFASSTLPFLASFAIVVIAFFGRPKPEVIKSSPPLLAAYLLALFAAMGLYYLGMLIHDYWRTGKFKGSLIGLIRTLASVLLLIPLITLPQVLGFGAFFWLFPLLFGIFLAINYLAKRLQKRWGVTEEEVGFGEAGKAKKLKK